MRQRIVEGKLLALLEMVRQGQIRFPVLSNGRGVFAVTDHEGKEAAGVPIAGDEFGGFA